jgi:predicted regulator of Ras-like GTPase activity (Roadblock/LC7/MglB family)
VIAAQRAQLSLTRERASELTDRLASLAATPGVTCTLLVDRAGRILALDGGPLDIDIVTFATLAAAEFNANEQLSRLVGDGCFRTLMHRGERTCVDLADVGRTALLVTLFETGTPPGLVRRAAESSAADCARVLHAMAEHAAGGNGKTEPVLSGAEEEIDRMFDW